MSEYVGEGQFTRVYRGAFAQPLPRELLTVAPEPALALKHVKTRLAHKERDYIIGEVRASKCETKKFYVYSVPTRTETLVSYSKFRTWQSLCIY